MKRVFGILAVGALMTMGAMADTWTGTISDSMCGAKHVAGTAADVKCVTACVKKGAEPVFVSDGKVLNLTADSKEKVMDMLGKKVTITGSLVEGAVKVEDIKAAE